jgi:hypothetical protein
MKSTNLRELLMIKILVPLLLALTLTSVAQASPESCFDALTNGHTEDSRTFSVRLTDLDEMRDYGRDFQAEAIYVIRELVKELGCSRKDLNFGRGVHGRAKHLCKNLIPGRSHTAVCYIETNLGYFFMTKDFLEKANVTYNRWD